MHTIAIAPNGGVLADSIAVKLLKYGFKVIDTGQVSNLMVRLNLDELEVYEPQNLRVLKEQGIDGVLQVKGVGGYDGRPNSASVKITSTVDGSVVAGVSWQNGRAGAQGSPADGFARVDLEQAAQKIAADPLPVCPILERELRQLASEPSWSLGRVLVAQILSKRPKAGPGA